MLIALGNETPSQNSRLMDFSVFSSIFSKWNTNPWPQDLFPYLPSKLPFFLHLYMQLCHQGFHFRARKAQLRLLPEKFRLRIFQEFQPCSEINGINIPFLWSFWTHVRSCNNACTFPSSSPANGQGGSSRESGTINQLSAPGCEDHQNSLQPHRRYPPTAEMLWLCPVMDTSYQCFKTAQASARISVEGLGTPIKQSSTKTEDLASNLWVYIYILFSLYAYILWMYIVCIYLYL